MQEFQNVQITCVGHSGSSLLNLVLGAHSQITSTGELMSLQNVYSYENCACGRRLNNCPFWQEVIDLVTTAAAIPLDGFSHALPMRDGAYRHRRTAAQRCHELLLLTANRHTLPIFKSLGGGVRRSLFAASNNYDVLAAVARLAGTPVVVDSSKNPFRTRSLFFAHPDDLRVIHMVRDGRAVARSWVKAYGKFDYAGAARQWLYRDSAIRMAIRDIPESRRIRLRYEDLCRSPETALDRICDFLGLKYEPEMISYLASERHDVHINLRPLHQQSEIQLDERWKEEVTSDQMSQFARIAGKLNRLYGYK